MTINHHNVDQGSDEWHALRTGMLTASEIKLIMTPTGKPANNDKSRAHLYELLAQRITGHTEPSYISDDMLRGMGDELLARELYHEHYAPVQDVGFITNDQWGFTLGYSPDGLVGDDGTIEIKSRRQKYQVQTAVLGEAPAEYMLQIQTGLLVTGREWCDFISYSGGLPMVVFRVHRDEEMQGRIVQAARSFEEQLDRNHRIFDTATRLHKWLPTERTKEEEIVI